jgi:hypothetical protein
LGREFPCVVAGDCSRGTRPLVHSVRPSRTGG